jgi:hypothetical protein
MVVSMMGAFGALDMARRERASSERSAEIPVDAGLIVTSMLPKACLPKVGTGFGIKTCAKPKS